MFKMKCAILLAVLAFVSLVLAEQTTAIPSSPECQVNPDGHGKCIDVCKNKNKSVGCCYPNDPNEADVRKGVDGRCVCCPMTDVCIPWRTKYNGRSCPSVCQYANGDKCPEERKSN